MTDAPLAPDGAFLTALRGTRPTPTPVWFAGPAGPPFDLTAPGGPGAALDADPARIAGRTVEPVIRHGVDAALLAAHVAVPLHLAGVGLDVDARGGLRVLEPVRTGTAVLHLRPIDPDRLAPISEAVALARTALDGPPLVAIAAAPFTLATLLIEGQPGGDRRRSRTMMYADPHSWAALLNWCADVAGASLRAQLAAGAAAVQLVDPALGALGRNDYFKRVLPHTQRVITHLRGLDVPIIHTGFGTGEVLDLMARAGATAVGVDHRIRLDTAAERVRGDVPLVGGLDPALLAAPPHLLAAHVHDALERGASAGAHILDLGGALPPATDPGVLTRIVELVRGG